jgi:superfamily II DNA/RNA helicase
LQRAREEAEVADLRARIALLPPPGAAALDSLRFFRELPLSRRTLEGLEAAGWVELTEIQRAAVPAALQGRDVLGAAKTGSGKTLAFVVPVRRTCTHSCTHTQRDREIERLTHALHVHIRTHTYTHTRSYTHALRHKYIRIDIIYTRMYGPGSGADAA